MVKRKVVHGSPLPQTDATTRDRISARRAVQTFEPMLAQFLSQIEVFYTTGDTCYTDGKRIYISESFIKKLPRGGVFAMYHELWHIAYGHLPIYKALEGKPWEHELHNILADAKINEQARHRINFTEKEWAKYKTIIRVDNVCQILSNSLKKGWEEALKDIAITDTARAFTALKPFVYQPFQYGGLGTIEGLGELGDGFDERTQRENESKIAASIEAAKMRGTAGGALESELEDIWLRKQVPWARIIAQSVLTRFRKEKTWAKFHKKTYYV